MALGIQIDRWIGESRGGVISAVLVVGISCISNGASANPGGNQIIWDDTPSSSPASMGEPMPEGAPPLAVPKSSSPIRDNFSHSGSKAADPIAGKGAPVTTSMAVGPCRDFQERVTIEGRAQQVHGRACRQPDGSWRIVN